MHKLIIYSKQKNYIYIILFIFLYLLSSCSKQEDIEADDFGFERIFVNASDQTNEIIAENSPYELKKWQDSHLKTTGSPLIISIPTSSYWVGWLGDSVKDKSSPIPGSIQYPNCKYEFNNNKNIISDNDFHKVEIIKEKNAPCKIQNGIGLYGIMTDKDLSAINEVETRLELEDPIANNYLLFHLGQSEIIQIANQDLLPRLFGNQTTTSSGKKINMFGYSPMLKKLILTYDEAKTAKNFEVKNHQLKNLYFQILDNKYSDNTGGYEVVIRSGAQNTNLSLNYIDQEIMDPIFNKKNGIVQQIYSATIQDSNFIAAASFGLITYCIILGILFLSGDIAITINSFAMHIFKISLIITLISSKLSWEFFYNYVFVFFIDFVNYLKTEITNNLNNSNSDGLLFIIKLLFGKEFLARIFAIMKILNPITWIYAILVYIIILLIGIEFLLIYIKYTIVMLTVGILIATSPVFIPFILFENTKSFCYEWFKNIFNNTIQIVLIFTGMVFISNQIQELTQKYFGFGVCYKNSIFNLYYPTTCINPNKGKMLVPNEFIEKEDRILGLPFLDIKKQADKEIAKKMLSKSFVFFEYILQLLILLYIYKKYNKYIESIAQSISGANGIISSTAILEYKGVSFITQQLGNLTKTEKEKQKEKEIGKKIDKNMNSGISSTLRSGLGDLTATSFHILALKRGDVGLKNKNFFSKTGDLINKTNDFIKENMDSDFKLLSQEGLTNNTIQLANNIKNTVEYLSKKYVEIKNYFYDTPEKKKLKYGLSLIEQLKNNKSNVAYDNKLMKAHIDNLTDKGYFGGRKRFFNSKKNIRNRILAQIKTEKYMKNLDIIRTLTGQSIDPELLKKFNNLKDQLLDIDKNVDAGKRNSLTSKEEKKIFRRFFSNLSESEIIFITNLNKISQDKKNDKDFQEKKKGLNKNLNKIEKLKKQLELEKKNQDNEKLIDLKYQMLNNTKKINNDNISYEEKEKLANKNYNLYIKTEIITSNTRKIISKITKINDNIANKYYNSIDHNSENHIQELNKPLDNYENKPNLRIYKAILSEHGIPVMDKNDLSYMNKYGLNISKNNAGEYINNDIEIGRKFIDSYNKIISKDQITDYKDILEKIDNITKEKINNFTQDNTNANLTEKQIIKKIETDNEFKDLTKQLSKFNEELFDKSFIKNVKNISNIKEDEFSNYINKFNKDLILDDDSKKSIMNKIKEVSNASIIQCLKNKKAYMNS